METQKIQTPRVKVKKRGGPPIWKKRENKKVNPQGGKGEGLAPKSQKGLRGQFETGPTRWKEAEIKVET